MLNPEPHRLVGKKDLNRIAGRRLPALLLHNPFRYKFGHCLARGFALQIDELWRRCFFTKALRA